MGVPALPSEGDAAQFDGKARRVITALLRNITYLRTTVATLSTALAKVSTTTKTVTTTEVVGSAYYLKTLSGLSVSVPAAEHQLAQVTNVLVLNPDADEVSVFNRIVSGTVTIDSNIALDNHLLVLS